MQISLFYDLNNHLKPFVLGGVVKKLLVQKLRQSWVGMGGNQNMGGMQGNQRGDYGPSRGISTMLRVNAGQVEAKNKMMVEGLLGGCAEPNASTVPWTEGNNGHLLRQGDDVMGG